MLIAHATDLTGHDEAAFVYATALAASAGARLVTIHGNAADIAPSALPDARALAARWGRRLTHDRLCHDCCDDVADTVLDALRTLHPDLVVLGTHGRHGFAALVHPSIEEAITRNLTMPVLVVPNECRGFVDPATGAIDLRRVVIYATEANEVRAASQAADSLVALTRSQAPSFTVIGTHQNLADERACLIALASRATRVIRDSTCPVLVAPAPR